MMRKLTALPQDVDGTHWVFNEWSHGEAADHFITTPVTDTTYRAVFVADAHQASK